MKKSIKIGTRFGNLIVEKYLGSAKYQNRYLCKCDCGNMRNTCLSNLIRGIVKHCGCKNYLTRHGNCIYSPEEASFRAKAASYKACARKRKLEFLLSLEECGDIMKKNCYYCNKSPSNVYNARISNRINKKNIKNYAINHGEGYEIHWNGIDRVDNTKGYTKENTVPCCTQCNTAKFNFTLEEFKIWVERVYLNYIKK